MGVDQEIVAPGNPLAKHHRGALDLLGLGNDGEDVVHAGGLEEIDRHGPHHETEAFPIGFFEVGAVLGAGEPQHVGPPAFHETQVARVIDDAGEVGVLIIDTHRQVMAAVTDFAVEVGRNHSAVLPIPRVRASVKGGAVVVFPEQAELRWVAARCRKA
jgi:hypothetical protein